MLESGGAAFLPAHRIRVVVVGVLVPVGVAVLLQLKESEGLRREGAEGSGGRGVAAGERER